MPADIDNFFDEMIKIYDYDWTNRYGSYDSGVWMSALQHLEPEELKAGIAAVIAEGTPYAKRPPKPLEFRELCRPYVRPVKENEFFVGHPLTADEWEEAKASYRRAKESPSWPALKLVK